ncbi:hypothetical protein CLOM_g13820, partial [Closterium sp. NIES-68]
GDFLRVGEKQQAAFEALKTLLMSPPVLRIADPERPFEVITDASDIAIGAVLMQDFGNGLHQSHTSLAKCNLLSASTRYTTRRCWRLSTRSKSGGAT